MIMGIKCAEQAYYMFNFIFIRTIQFTHVRKHGMRSSFIAVVTSLNFALQTTVSIRSTNLLWKRKHHAALSKHRQETKSRSGQLQFLRVCCIAFNPGETLTKRCNVIWIAAYQSVSIITADHFYTICVFKRNIAIEKCGVSSIEESEAFLSFVPRTRIAITNFITMLQFWNAVYINKVLLFLSSMNIIF